MKAIEINEMRSVDGGYRCKCTKCGKTSGSVPSIGVTLFYLAHKHGSKSSYAVWDYSYKYADSWRS